MNNFLILFSIGLLLWIQIAPTCSEIENSQSDLIHESTDLPHSASSSSSSSSYPTTSSSTSTHHLFPFDTRAHLSRSKPFSLPHASFLRAASFPSRNLLLAAIYSLLADTLGVSLSGQLLILQSPGIVIDPASLNFATSPNSPFTVNPSSSSPFSSGAFNQASFASSSSANQSSSATSSLNPLLSPSLLQSQLADRLAAPVLLATPPPTGSASLEEHWRRLLAQYQWYDLTYERELCHLEALLPTLPVLFEARDRLAQNLQDTIAYVDLLYRKCTRVHPASTVCSQRNATVWRAMVLEVEEELAHIAQWTDLRLTMLSKLHARNGDSILAASALDVSANTISTSSNTIAVAQPILYLDSQFFPLNWADYFDNLDNATSSSDPSSNASTTTAAFNSTSSKSTLYSSFRTLSLSSADLPSFLDDANVHPQYFDLHGDLVSSHFDLVGASYPDTPWNLTFQLALVYIDRPWLDLNILRHVLPLRVRGDPFSTWSNGQKTANNTGSFPTVSSAFLVARHVCLLGDPPVSPSSLSSISDLLFGPFTLQGDFYSIAYPGATRLQSWSLTPGGFCIDFPQIIGWLADAVPKFPTADPLPSNWTPATCPELLGSKLPPDPVDPLAPPPDVTPPLTPPYFYPTPEPVPPTDTPDPMNSTGIFGMMPVWSGANTLTPFFYLNYLPFIFILITFYLF